VIMRAVLTTLVLFALSSACGSKTQLLIERCEDVGTRACTSICGPGTQSCVDGYWSTCEPDAIEPTCENVCGTGTRMCTEAGLSECVVPVSERPCSVVCGDGIETCRNGRWGPCSAPGPLPPTVATTVRDFASSHPDFERMRIGRDRGIVQDELGADDKPVYAGGSSTTSGRESFDEWYRDVPGVNLSAPLDLRLRSAEPGGAVFTFDEPMFFPIDGMLFGDEGRRHNFHFTLEAVTSFVYEGGETFRFRGDDDVFVFINRRLVIDLGGIHSAEQADVDLDERADELGLVVGERFPLHVFFAERHTTESSFRIETTLTDRVLRCE